MSSGAVHFEIKVTTVKDEKTKMYGPSKIGALVNEFELFLNSQALAEKETLRKMGIDYIEKIETTEEET
jgi:hypothetical protein